MAERPVANVMDTQIAESFRYLTLIPVDAVCVSEVKINSNGVAEAVDGALFDRLRRFRAARAEECNGV